MWIMICCWEISLVQNPAEHFKSRMWAPKRPWANVIRRDKNHLYFLCKRATVCQRCEAFTFSLVVYQKQESIFSVHSANYGCQQIFDNRPAYQRDPFWYSRSFLPRQLFNCLFGFIISAKNLRYILISMDSMKLFFSSILQKAFSALCV